MKAAIDDLVELVEDAESDFSEDIIPLGTGGVVVECYSDPEGYAVEVAIPDASLVGSHCYDLVQLTPEQFKVLEHHED
jgi:hypothetical protein